MRISNLRDLPNEKHLRFDDTGREIYTIKVEDVVFDGRSVHYPNCLLKTKDGQLINPYDERVMSLQKDSFYDGNEWELSLRGSLCCPKIEQMCGSREY